MTQWWQRIPADMDPVDVAVMHALHHYGGAEKRWAERAHSGLTDNELRQILSDELGDGGSAGPGQLAEAHKGGRDPLIIVNAFSRYSREPDDPSRPIVRLKGKALLDTARRLLRIPYPAEAQAGVQQIAMW